jgi:hypothetical protein
VRKHPGSFAEDKEAEYDFSACQHRARVIKRTSTRPSQVPKHGIGLLKSRPGKAERPETGRIAKLRDLEWSHMRVLVDR